MNGKLAVSLLLLTVALLLLPAALGGHKDSLAFSAKPSLAGITLMGDLAKDTGMLADSLDKVSAHLAYLKDAGTFPVKQLPLMKKVVGAMDQQEKKLGKAVAVLDRVRRQTHYTRSLVERTLALTLSLESETGKNLHISANLAKEIKQAATRLKQLEVKLNASEKTYRSINKKLPKNLPI